MAASAPTLSPFEQIVLSSKNNFGVCFVLLLAWIAACDGEASGEEVQQIRSLTAHSPDAHHIDAIVDIAKSGNTEALQLACEIIRQSVEREKARSLFTVFLTVAVADNLLRPSENFVLRFLADLLRLSPEEMNECFFELTGRQFPPAPDLSSGVWWNARDTKDRQQNSSKQSSAHNSGSAKAQNPNIERLRSLAILGLDEDASNEEVKAAYRRLAQVHHPDRFASLGPEAVEAASASFRRIKQAYDHLSANA